MTPDDHSPKFTEAYAAFLLAKRSENVSASMIELYTATRGYLLRRFGDLRLDDLKPENLRTFLLWLQGNDESTAIAAPPGRKGKLADSTIDMQYRQLKTFFNWCEDEELIARSPMRKIKKPKGESVLPDALTEAEADHLLECVRTSGDHNAWRDYCVHLFFLDTGVRLEELSELDLDSLNFEEGYARVFGKGRKERIVPMGLELRRELNRYLLKHRRPVKGERALFVNEHGYRLGKRGVAAMVTRDLRKYVERELNQHGPHTLRHTSATFNVRYTGDLKTTSLILGHTTTRTTERYTHLTGSDVLRNAAGSPMDQILRGRRNGKGDSSRGNGNLD
ncbi:MAG TPA: tyrosine-type recombinase/integrase [Anaerolineae bacterium]